MKYIYILMILANTFINANDLKRVSNWYFGYQFGITFNTPDSEPIETFDNMLITNEATSCMSDENGKVRIYANGDSLVTIDNNGIRTPRSYPNLNTGISSSQGVLLIPNGNNEEYHVLLSPDIKNTNKGNRYNVWDFNKNSSLSTKGDWSFNSKEMYLFNTSPSERLGSTLNLFDSTYWVATKARYNQQVRIQKLTKNGFDSEEKNFFSLNGIINQFEGDWFGFIKFSPDGNWMVITYRLPVFELYKFDNRSGEVQLYLCDTIGNTNSLSNGVEFSHNSHYLYFTHNYVDEVDLNEYGQIYQYDLKKSADLMKLDKIKVFQEQGKFRGMQLAPNGKIYFNLERASRRTFLGAIQKPYLSGLLSDVKDSILVSRASLDYSKNKDSLKKLGQALPNFPSNFFNNIKIEGINDTSPNCKPDLNITIEDKTLNIGKEFCVNVNIKGSCPIGSTFNGFYIDLSYDSSVVKFNKSNRRYTILPDKERNKIIRLFYDTIKTLPNFNLSSQICFRAFLSDTLETSISIKTDTNYNLINSDNGNLKFNLCGGKLRFVNFFKKTTIKPVIDNQNLSLLLTREIIDNYNISLIPVSGNSIIDYSINTEPRQYSNEEVFRIPISQISSGFYLLIIKNSIGEVLQTEKIIIEK